MSCQGAACTVQHRNPGCAGGRNNKESKRLNDIAALTQKLAKAEQERDQARAQVKVLEGENAQMRGALNRIANPLIATRGDVANRIAYEALAATEPTP